MPDGLLSSALNTFCAIFFVVDPFAAVPLYLTMVEGDSALQCRRTAVKAALTVLVTLSVFAVAGGLIFHLFGISIGAFRVAGGALLFLMAVDMMRAHHSPTRTSEAELAEGVEKPETGIVPLGMPMLAGPGAIATVTVLMSNARGSATHMLIIGVCVLLTSILTVVILLAANQLQRVLRTTGLNVINRVMGLILAAVAVQFIATGVAELFSAAGGQAMTERLSMPHVDKTWLIAGAVNGLIAVAAGAFGAHALKDLPERYLNAFRTGAQYELVHAVVLLFLALLPPTLLTRIAGGCFLAGIVLFSGSLYVLALTRIGWLGAITPLGGVLMIAGWAALIIVGATLVTRA